MLSSPDHRCLRNDLFYVNWSLTETYWLLVHHLVSGFKRKELLITDFAQLITIDCYFWAFSFWDASSAKYSSLEAGLLGLIRCLRCTRWRFALGKGKNHWSGERFSPETVMNIYDTWQLSTQLQYHVILNSQGSHCSELLSLMERIALQGENLGLAIQNCGHSAYLARCSLLPGNVMLRPIH